MKSNRYGQARVLSTGQLDLLIAHLPGEHHRVVAEICRRTGCRVGEATQVTWGMVSESAITFHRGITQGKLASRSVPTVPVLWVYCWLGDVSGRLIRAVNHGGMSMSFQGDSPGLACQQEASWMPLKGPPLKRA